MMRGAWDRSRLPGGRRTTRLGSPVSGSPFNFSSDEEERLDPVELLAIRADDELLDELSAGRLAGPAYTDGVNADLDSGYADDQQVLALLAELRAEIDSVPIPELLTVDEACTAVLAGRRAGRRRRRLIPVAAAAAAVVMGLSVTAGMARDAQPGDALWGVSTMIDSNRARSVEAAYRVNLALSRAQQALAEGRVADARAALETVGPDLSAVADPKRQNELSRKRQNLAATVDAAREGERVDTDESGTPRDSSWAGRHRWNPSNGGSSASPGSASPGSGSSGAAGSNPGSAGPGSGSSGAGAHPGQGTDPDRPNQTDRPDPRSLFAPTTRPGFPGSADRPSPPWDPRPTRPRPGTPDAAERSTSPTAPDDPRHSTPAGNGSGTGSGSGTTGNSGKPGDPRGGTTPGNGSDFRHSPTAQPPTTTTPGSSSACSGPNASKPAPGSDCARPR